MFKSLNKYVFDAANVKQVCLKVLLQIVPLNKDLSTQASELWNEGEKVVIYEAYYFPWMPVFLLFNTVYAFTAYFPYLVSIICFVLCISTEINQERFANITKH